MFQADSTLKGVINSFVEVEDYKKKGQLDVRFYLVIFRKLHMAWDSLTLVYLQYCPVSAVRGYI